MADKTPDQLTAVTDLVDNDLLLAYSQADAVLRKVEWSVFLGLVVDDVSAQVLIASNNLSDLPNAATARGNLGLGSAAVLAASAVLQAANNLSEIANAATARTNIGAAASSAPSFTNGVTYSGGTKANVSALAALAIDVSAADFFTKSISTNSTFTFTGATASKAEAFILDLTITSAAVPTWPASVKWASGNAPTLGNGRHILGFLTTDGGTTWVGIMGARAVA